jgi:cell division protein FtsN
MASNAKLTPVLRQVVPRRHQTIHRRVRKRQLQRHCRHRLRNDPANNASSGLGGILSKDSPPPPVAAPMPTTQPPSSTSKDPISDAIKGNTASIEDRTSYQLQAGAYRQQEDAESMKAKLSLLGYESRILNAQVNGETLYRVRVGPYKQFEDMNKAKNRLSENKVEVTVIKIKPAN